MEHHALYPPKWPVKLLRFFVKAEYLEEIEGDMEEIFYENVERFSVRKARRMYALEMIKLLRPNLIKNLEFVNFLMHYGMFKNYFKVSFRTLMRNPVNSFINVFGLAVAIGLCVFAYAFARWTYSTDQFHVNKDNVHLITFFANRDGTLQQYGQSPRPLGELLKQDFVQVQKTCRVEDRHVVVKYDDNVFHERIRFTDPEFLSMLTFPLKWGTSNSLQDLNSIVLSEKMSEKYFGEENPLNRDLLLKFDENQTKAFKVTGVAKAFPDAHTIDFDFLTNIENLRTFDSNYDESEWREFVNATLIQLSSPADLKVIEHGMEKYRLLQNNAVEEDWSIASFKLEPLATLHLNSGNIQNDISISSSARTESIVFIAIICLIMLGLACFNYINIAIVTAVKRLKEIGVRKTIGASRNIVMIQFLTENLVVTSLATITGILLGKFVFIPWIENVIDSNMGFTLIDINLWLYLPAVLIFTAIASGIYPSLYISRFQVAGILKGSVRFGTKNHLTKFFLGIQLILACILITAGIMFTQNTAYMAKRSWGYNKEQTLYLALPDRAAFEKLKPLLEQDPTIHLISGSQHHLGKSHIKTVLRMANRQFEVDQMNVDAQYFETMGLQMEAGRMFREDQESDKQTAVINEEFAKTITGHSLVNPSEVIGQAFKIDSIQYEVIGVLKDFHSYSFFRRMNPAIFTLADKEAYRFMSLKVESGTKYETAQKIRSNWASLYPETPFDGGFQEDIWGDYNEKLDEHASVWKAFASLAVILTSLGLYGLVSLNVSGRTKEFSIRKILGANLKNMVGNITRQYMMLFGIGLSIGAPISYFLIKTLFDRIYVYHIPITYSGVMAAIIILIFVLMITISTQVKKVMKSNPVLGLKSE